MQHNEPQSCQAAQAAALDIPFGEQNTQPEFVPVQKTPAAARKQKSTGKKVREFLVIIAIAVAIGLLLRVFVVEFTMVQGASMEPTLYTGERLLVSKLNYKLGTPGRYEVVTCKYPNMTGVYVKRVMGLPGETIEIKSGKVYINGEPLSDDRGVATNGQNVPAQVVPEGHVFVMGDNRDVSLDSRSLGPIAIDQLIGRAYAIIWPINKIGGIP